MKKVEPTQFAGVSFVGDPALIGLERVLDGGISSWNDLEHAEGMLRALIFHGDCKVLSDRPIHAAFANIGVAPFDAYQFAVGAIPPEAQQLVDDANNALTEFSNRRFSEAVASGRLIRTRSGDDARRLLGTPHVAGTAHGFFSMEGIQAPQQRLFEDTNWALRYSAAYSGGGALWGVEDRKSRFVESFDQAHDPSWLIAKKLQGQVVPAAALPWILPTILKRCQSREDLWDEVLSLRNELQPTVAEFHALLVSSSVTNPEFEEEARAAAEQLNRIRQSFFRAADATHSKPSYLRSFGPKLVMWGAALFGYFTGEPLLALVGKAAEEVLRQLEGTKWATRPFSPSLSDHLIGLRHTSDPNEIVALLRKHFTAEEVSAIEHGPAPVATFTPTPPDGSSRLTARTSSPRSSAGASAKKVGRNDPCHCGSGRKKKKCHPD
jgi:hypothetical protein